MSWISGWPQLNGLLLRPPGSNLHISEVDELKLSRLASTCQIFALTINQYNFCIGQPQQRSHINGSGSKPTLLVNRFSFGMKWPIGQTTSEKMVTNIGPNGPKSPYNLRISN